MLKQDHFKTEFVIKYILKVLKWLFLADQVAFPLVNVQPLRNAFSGRGIVGFVVTLRNNVGEGI